MPVLTFTSDFGADSSYVAQMKAAALRVTPELTLVDVTHSIEPQDIAGGGVVLEDCLPHFPPGSAHVAVVDPGVGTERPIVAADLDGRLVVAPDNRLIGLVMRRLPLRQAVRVERRAEFGDSNTFHGRDIMAPAAALLCAGLPLSELGPAHQPLGWSDELPPPRASQEADRLTGQIVNIDRFGNLITNIFHDQLPSAALRVRLGEWSVEGLQATYGRQLGDLVALIGSCERLEIAVVSGSAAERTGARQGDLVEVSWEAAAR